MGQVRQAWKARLLSRPCRRGDVGQEREERKELETMKKFTTGPGKREITFTWTLDFEDMEAIGHVIQSAGIGSLGDIRDRGFYDDGTAILTAVWKAEDDL